MISASALNSGHALSRVHQPAIAELVSAIASSETVTVFVGAGFSIDAGMPSWPMLISQLLIGLEATPAIDRAKLAAADDDDLMRKAEWIVRMRLKQDNYGDPFQLVRDALYQNTADARPGPLLRALTGLLSSLDTRAVVMTTNFDDMIERVLAEDMDVSRKAQTIVSDQRDYLIDKFSEARPTSVPVFHLHGYIPPFENERSTRREARFLVLAESQFLKYGIVVRGVIAHALQNSTVLFLGASLTDPNVIGPLWDTRRRRQRAFVVNVPKRLGPSTSWEASREFAIAKSEYIENELSVSPIFLKSYGQLEQLISELRLALTDPASYLKPRSPLTYGRRLSKHLDRAYEAMGFSRSGPRLSADNGVKVQNSLRAVLAKSRKPTSVRQELDFALRDPALATDLEILRRSVGSPPRADEEFGLSIWLRVRERSAREPARYAVQQVAHSDLLTHSQSVRDGVIVDVLPDSDYPAARAVANPKGLITNSPPELTWGGMWPGVVAVPLRIWEKGFKGGAESPICIGAVCLHSSHAMWQEGDESLAGSQVSIISVMKVAMRQRLCDAIERAGRGLVNARGGWDLH